jgi:hypothetical protein
MQMQKALAWGSTCGSAPDLYVCVAGCEQFLLKDVGIRNFYFRKIPLNRILVNGGRDSNMLTFLTSNAGFVTGNSKNFSDDFKQIGVDVDEQSCLRLACIKKGEKHVNVNTISMSTPYPIDPRS